MSGVLRGLKVVDFGRYIAGPYCAALLGDLGADVIRVEKREGRDDRTLVSLSSNSEGEPLEGAIYLQCNRNKRSLTLDPMTPQGRDIVERLVARADVVVANLPAEALAAMGLDWENISRINPRAIGALVSAFGLTGPYAHRVGFDGVAQAMTGAVYMGGTEAQPVKSAAAYVDFGTASLLALGVLAALRARDETGKGQLVEASLLRTALTIFSPTLIEEACAEIGRRPTLNRSQNAAPSDVFRTKDGWISVAVNGEPLFRRAARTVGAVEWLKDSRLQSDKARGDWGEMISEHMQAWCAERTSAEATAALEGARIPVGPVNTPRQALDDPHIRQMGFLKEIAFPGLDKAMVAETPVTLHDHPGQVRFRPPTLGEHSNEILRELGFEDRDIDDFASRGII